MHYFIRYYKNVIKKCIDYDLANLLYLNQFVIKWCHTHHKYHILYWILLYNWNLIAIVLLYLKLSQWQPRRDDLYGLVFILGADDQILMIHAICTFFTPRILLFYRNICNIDGDIAENVNEICGVFDVYKIKNNHSFLNKITQYNNKKVHKYHVSHSNNIYRL